MNDDDDCTIDCMPIFGFHRNYFSSNGKVISKKSGNEPPRVN